MFMSHGCEYIVISRGGALTRSNVTETFHFIVDLKIEGFEVIVDHPDMDVLKNAFK